MFSLPVEVTEAIIYLVKDSWTLRYQMIPENHFVIKMLRYFVIVKLNVNRYLVATFNSWFFIKL